MSDTTRFTQNGPIEVVTTPTETMRERIGRWCVALLVTLLVALLALVLRDWLLANLATVLVIVAVVSGSGLLLIAWVRH